MADNSLKEKKLAAARKKLRKFQKKKDGIAKNRNTSPSLELASSQKSETSSRSSSVADFIEPESGHLAKSDVLPNSDSSTPNGLNIQTTKDYINNNSTEPVCSGSSSYTVPYSKFSSNNTPLLEKVDAHQYSSDAEDLTSHSDGQTFSIGLQENLSQNRVETKEYILDNCEIPDHEGSTCSETNASLTTVVHVKNKDLSDPSKGQDGHLRSTTESLRQLSLQMSGLVNDVEIQEPDRNELTIKELEKRNSELAALLDMEKQKSFELNSHINEMKITIESQNSQLQSFQTSVADTNGTEVNGLREQLQVHIQTIGILVAEKSELQTSLTHLRYSLDKKTGEATELQGRLDASRERVKSLEDSNRDLKSQLSALTDAKETDSQQLLNLQSNFAKLSKLCDEMRASTAELTERLAVRTEENEKLNTQLTEVRRQHELDQVHIDQLRNNSAEETRNKFLEIESALSKSQEEIQALKAKLQQAGNERDQMEFQYKSYTTQLAAESEDLKQKLTLELKRREKLEDRNEELELSLKSVELKAQPTISLEDIELEKNQLAKTIQDLTDSKRQLEDSCASMTRDNKQLSDLLAEQNAKIEILEAAAERTSTQQVDTTQLLQTMQSDKIAAARALAQNKQLKEQLEELQNGFVMMSNKKLELTEKLEKELHIKKNLYKEIAQLGEEVNSYKERLLRKQRETEAIGQFQRSSSGKRHEIREEPKRASDCCIDDDSSHQHVHGETCEGHNSCNEEHHSCNEEHHSCHEEHHPHNVEHNPHYAEFVRKAIDEFSATVGPSKRKMEVGAQLNDSGDIEKAEEVTEKCNIVPQSKNQELSQQRPDELPQELYTLRLAHEALEGRFLKCMRDLATVSDEKQNLEHLVQQLELETETVGDYITIYQFQRGVMKQEVQEMKNELELLRTEKRDIFSKLSTLQKLFERLDFSTDKNRTKEVFIHDINSIIRAANTSELKPAAAAATSLSTSTLQNGDADPAAADSTATEGSKAKLSRTDTVRQIIDLISEMETSSRIDTAAFHKCHPCSHCSGRLITI